MVYTERKASGYQKKNVVNESEKKKLTIIARKQNAFLSSR